MKSLHIEVSAIIDAAPEVVYAIISDYRDKEKGHQAILPPQNFKDFMVEEGGKGAGTVFRFRSAMGGPQQDMRMRVREPESGRVIVETELSTGLVTTFTIDPYQNGQQTRFTIATEWEARPGLMGLLESLLAPGMLRKVYRKEMQNLNQLVRANAEEVDVKASYA